MLQMELNQQIHNALRFNLQVQAISLGKTLADLQNLNHVSLIVFQLSLTTWSHGNHTGRVEDSGILQVTFFHYQNETYPRIPRAALKPAFLQATHGYSDVSTLLKVLHLTLSSSVLAKINAKSLKTP